MEEDIEYDKVYDGTDATYYGSGIIDGIAPVDVGKVFVTNHARYNSKDVADADRVLVTYTLTGSRAYNYYPPESYEIMNAVIRPKMVQLVGLKAEDKMYDGTTDVMLTEGTLEGVISSDSVGYRVIDPAFTDAKVGTKLVDYVLELTNNEKGNYELDEKPILTANITPAPVLITKVNADKVYDGTTSATLSGGILVDIIGNDDVSIDLSNAIATFPSKHVGFKELNASGIALKGKDAGNYYLANEPIVTGTITPRPITVFNENITTIKIYDGTTDVTFIPGTDDILPMDNEEVTLQTFVYYTDPNVNGNEGSIIQVEYNLMGTGANNYLKPEVKTISATIMPRQLTIEDPMYTAHKLFDSETTAEVSPGALLNVVDGDEVFVHATGSFSQSAAGKNLPLIVSYDLSGADAHNYSPPVDYNTHGTIYKRLGVLAYLEGFCQEEVWLMKQCQTYDEDEDRMINKFGTLTDKIGIELRSASNYNDIVWAQYDLYIEQDGWFRWNQDISDIGIDPDLNGAYYLTIVHRNSLSVSTKSPLSFEQDMVIFDFSTKIDDVYATDPTLPPMKYDNKHQRWMLYTGNSFDEGLGYDEINIADVYDIFNNRTQVVGYKDYANQDLNGDGEIDDTDVYEAFNNRDILFFRQ